MTARARAADSEEHVPVIREFKERRHSEQHRFTDIQQSVMSPGCSSSSNEPCWSEGCSRSQRGAAAALICTAASLSVLVGGGRTFWKLRLAALSRCFQDGGWSVWPLKSGGREEQP